jgi:hypothetical protein
LFFDLISREEEEGICFRFFSRAKNRFKHSNEEEIERIAAIPSVEDTTRSFPHWTIYIAWGCKINQFELIFSSYFLFS